MEQNLINPNSTQISLDNYGNNGALNNKKRRVFKIIIGIVLCFFVVFGVGIGLYYSKGKNLRTRIVLGDGLEMSLVLPDYFALTEDFDSNFPSWRVVDLSNERKLITFSLNPYLVPNFISEKDGQIEIDGINFVLANSDKIICPMHSIFPEQASKQPYTLGFNIATFCSAAEQEKYEPELNQIISSIRFNQQMKEALLSENYENGILNPAFKVLNRSIDELKSLLLEYVLKINFESLSVDIEQARKDYNLEDLFSLSYETINGSMYPLIEEIGTNPFKKGSGLYVLNDPLFHRYIYEYLLRFYPESIIGNIDFLFFGTDGLFNNLAWVGRESDKTASLILYVDIVDLVNSLQENRSDFQETLIHESAHTLNFRNDQLSVDYSGFDEKKLACETYYIEDWGCTFLYSYLNQFYAKFWEGKYMDRPENLDSWEDRVKYKNKYNRDFVTAYSTTNPLEDFAESLLYYVLTDDPEAETEKGTVIGDKINYFHGTKGLSNLRQIYRKSLGLSYEPVTEPSNLKQGQLLEEFKKLVPQFAAYLKSKEVNDCGDYVREGRCIHVDYYWGVDKTVEEVLRWYKNSLPPGWKMEGDMLKNGYAYLVKNDNSTRYLFFVKSGSLFPELGFKTVIFFPEYLD